MPRPLLAALLLSSFVAASPQPASAAPPTAELPLNRIVLYSTGVGFFERSGDIDGAKQVELKFNLEDVNDILKSMILRDYGGGQISHVTVDSPEPITRTLQTFAIDLAKNPTLSDLLKQIRGEKIQVMSPNPTIGTIVGIERRKQPVGKEQQVIEVDTLLLKTETGLRSIPLANVTETKILSETLDKEFQEALSILAQSHAKDKKTVALNCQGNGKRQVVVGYIQEAPVWKTTYRLALDAKDTHFLQGWAIVENTTEQDWKDVKVTLVGGRPVSFQMDLYQPLFADRPVVVPEAYTTLSPRVHDQNLLNANAQANPFQLGGGLSGGGGVGGGMGGFSGGLGGNVGGQAGGNQGGQGGVKMLRPGAATDPFGADDNKPAEPKMDLRNGVTSIAQASDVGELFRYAIKNPVSLAREKSALLPIINDPIKGTRLSLFNRDVHPKYPMNAVKLINNTKLHLTQGPITVFDGGEYAGDAQVEAIPPGNERLITYAVDLDVEVAYDVAPIVTKYMEVYIANGRIHAKRLAVRHQTYTLKNSTDKAKKVYLEIPWDAMWELREPKRPTEKTRDLYRFAVDVPARKTIEYRIVEDHELWEQNAITDLKPEMIALWIESVGRGSPSGDARLLAAGPAVQAAITALHKRQLAIDEVDAKRRLLDGEAADTKDDQGRIRLNMTNLDRTSDLYRRYEKTLGEQEDRLAKIRAEAKSVSAELAKLKKQLADYINELDVREKAQPADTK